MTRSYRRDRGRESEIVSANACKRVWPRAKPNGRSLAGRDILDTPPMAIEVKARSEFNPLAWIRQAEKNAGEDYPVVWMRPNGLGPESVGKWLAFMRVDDWLELCDRAGLGPVRRKSRKSSAKTRDRDPVSSVGVGLEPRADNASDATIKALMSAMLYQMDLEPGGYEVQIFRREGSSS